jgi:integrase
MLDPVLSPSIDPSLQSNVTRLNSVFAINCTESGVPSTVWEYVHASLSENTRRAYLSDLAHFQAWGGKLPATEEMLASYLAARAGRLNTSTLSRHLAALSKAHSGALDNPAHSPLVRATMRGIMRRHRRPPGQAKPLLRDELVALLDATGTGLRDVRDRALLLIGFAGAFRRSELVALNREDIAFCNEGVLLSVRRSKTDQHGRGRRIAVTYGKERWCAVASLREWIERSRIEHGPLFVHVNRHGHLLNRLSGEGVSLILRNRVAAAGLCAAAYSGHSLRAGFATSAARAGKSIWEMRRQTGHKSTSTLAGYIRDHELFTHASSLL